MASITRQELAERAHHALGKLANDDSIAPRGGAPEGDYTDAIEDTLLDCGFDSVAEATSHAKVRALLRGTIFYAAQTVYRDRAAQVTSQQGAGASGMHLSLDWGQALGSLRLHVSQVRDDYELALSAIGRSLGLDPGAVSIAGVVQINDADPKTQVLVDSSLGLPWYREGYHEVDQ